MKIYKRFCSVLVAGISLTFLSATAAWGETLSMIPLTSNASGNALGTSTASASALASASASTRGEKLSTLEEHYFGHSFASEKEEKRLRRLEYLVFGQSNESKDSNSRVANIEQIVSDLAQKKLDDQAKALAAEKAAINAAKSAKAEKPVKLTFNKAYALAAQELRQKRYHAAADAYLKVISINPRYSPAYAYLGDILVKLKDYEGAKEAYRAGFEVDPFGQYGRYGKAKLMGLAKRDAYMRTQPQDSQLVVERTLKLINRQSNDLSSIHAAEGQRWSRWRTDLANIQLRRIAQESNTSVNYLSRRGYQGYDDREQSNLANLRNNYVRNDAAVQATKIRAEAARKAAFVAQSAADLKAQMMQPVRPGNARLRALGTNLYVRYYGSDTPSWNDGPVADDAPVELAAKAHKLR
ncbi:tetratricopeptide repeat protein [bacterium]|nr:tetratricopeptide repeat protein [bacterium]MBP9809342.1 tetratricopeptide repeat protein [bacterium]